MATSRSRPFTLSPDIADALATLPMTRSAAFGKALDLAHAQPGTLGAALARRARHEPQAEPKTYTVTTPPDFLDKLEELSQQMTLPREAVIRLALEAFLVEKAVWEP